MQCNIIKMVFWFQVLEVRHLQPVASQVLKILQLYEALRQRMGCVLVGPSGCGMHAYKYTKLFVKEWDVCYINLWKNY